jgi:short subunit dehydrogenase-like uncharacterized protein
MSRKVDILVLGATGPFQMHFFDGLMLTGSTGFTGRLVTKHLNEHRDRASFSFALAARSKSKLETLVNEFDLSSQIPLIYLDVTNEDQVEEVVKTSRVVVNTVGPYWRWGTPVVR